jgi:hypothetical protein
MAGYPDPVRRFPEGAYWLDFQSYFGKDVTRKPKKGAKEVRVHVPKRQAVNRRPIAKMRDLKQKALHLAIGADS